MKKLISLTLALMLVLSLATVAFATTYEDESTVTISKTYSLTNTGTTSPAETFSFSTLTCTGIQNVGVNADGEPYYTISNAPVPTIGNIEYTAGEAGSATMTKTATITLPGYEAVGIYTYTFTETDGGTAGVTYRSDAIKLVVTVIEQNGKVRVAAVHTEDEGAKSGSFDNTYSAGSLSVSKTVTGAFGDLNKYFDVKVTFTAPEGDTVKSDITYMVGTETKTIEAGETGWSGSKEVTISLKSGDTITFDNIPYGVTYTVVENDYTSAENGGYDVPVYTYSDDANKKIDSDEDTVSITNNKGGDVDTGITLDSVPFILILAVCAGAVVLFVVKRRRSVDF